MTLTPRRAQLLVTQLIVDLGTLVDRIGPAVQNELNIIHGHDPDDRPRAADAGIRGKGWITDPTGERATSIVTGESRDLENILLNLQAMNGSVAYLRTFIERRNPTIAERRLCGDYSPSSVRQHPAFDASCRRIAESDRTPDGRLHWRSSGLCAGCRRRLARYDSGHDDAA